MLLWTSDGLKPHMRVCSVRVYMRVKVHWKWEFENDNGEPYARVCVCVCAVMLLGGVYSFLYTWVQFLIRY
jgi:hypothetical protein